MWTKPGALPTRCRLWSEFIRNDADQAVVGGFPLEDESIEAPGVWFPRLIVQEKMNKVDGAVFTGGFPPSCGCLAGEWALAKAVHSRMLGGVWSCCAGHWQTAM
jgi:hypothetical protein